MDKDTVDVFLPDPDGCYERRRRARFGATESCVYCGGSEPAIRKGTTGKGAQQYRCKDCKTYFNELTGTVFENRKFPLEEMFYMLKEMRSVPTAQIAADLGRDKDAALDVRHAVQEACSDIDEITLSGVCEADEIYVTAGEKGVEKEDEEGRDCGLKKGRGSFESDKPPVVTLVRRSDGRALGIWCERHSKTWTKRSPSWAMARRFCVTDDYSIYDDIDEYDGIDAHLAITHDDAYVIGDAHVNSCEITVTASFASGWRSSETSPSTISKATSTFSVFCKMKREIGSAQS